MRLEAEVEEKRGRQVSLKLCVDYGEEERKVAIIFVGKFLGEGQVRSYTAE